jgi:hypothetical protein
MAPRLNIPLKALAASAAGLIGFVLTGGFWLSLGPVEGWPFLALFVGVPAAVIALMPLRARAFCFVLALLAMLGSAWMDISSPDNPLLIFPLAAVSISVAAVIAELCVRAALRVACFGKPRCIASD